MHCRIVVRLLFGALLACGSDGPGGSGATPESWEGTFEGTSDTSAFFCTNGIVAYQGTFTLDLPSSLVAALKIPYDADARIRSGSGSFNTDVKGTPDCQDGPNKIVPQTLTNVATARDAIRDSARGWHGVRGAVNEAGASG